MKSMFVSAVLASVVLSPALAQPKPEDHAAHHPAAAASAVEMADGEVRRVDKGANKLTIKHGEIKNLDMPPMTMVFQVKDGALLDKVTAGDKIRFVAEKSASGYIVTAIEAVK
jgi:Cu(I)/Ag(I) efflux system protein CusF